MKTLFYRALSALFLALAVSFAYLKIYHGMIVDFSEGFSNLQLLALDSAICFFAVLLMGIFHFMLKNKNAATFVSNSLLFISSIAIVFAVLSMDDVQFKNEDAALFTDYFKGYLMPFIFIPYFSWFVISPLFSKN